MSEHSWLASFAKTILARELLTNVACTFHSDLCLPCLRCRQLQGGIAAAFATVHDPARLKAAVVALHHSLAARNAVKADVVVASGGAPVSSTETAAMKAEADRWAFSSRVAV